MTQQAALSVLGVLYATLLLGIACNAHLDSISLLGELRVNIALMLPVTANYVMEFLVNTVRVITIWMEEFANP